MQVNFRQGILSAPTNFLSFNAGVDFTATVPVIATVSSGSAEYLLTITQNTVGATHWTIPAPVPGTTYWMFWDVNTRTAELSCVYTTVAPIYSPSAPLSPVASTHWFDTSIDTMHVWDGTVWIRKIRVLAGTLLNSAITSALVASQSGNVSSYESGAIVYNSNHKAIRYNANSFLTSISPLIADDALVISSNIEARSIWLDTTENIDRFSVVCTDDNGTCRLAQPADVMIRNLGIADTTSVVGDGAHVVLGGKITNIDWNWAHVNDYVYVIANGVISTTPPPGATPVGRVVGPDTILFAPPLTASNGTTIINNSGGGLTLGITNATAFRGDYGNAAYQHSLITSGNPHGATTANVTEDPTNLYFTAPRALAAAPAETASTITSIVDGSPANTNILDTTSFAVTQTGALNYTTFATLKAKLKAYFDPFYLNDPLQRVLDGFLPAAGVIAATDTILVAFNKLVGNVANYLPLGGGTMLGDIISNYHRVSKALLDGYVDNVQVAPIVSTVLNIDCSLGQVYTTTHDANILTLSFSNIHATGATSVTLLLKQDATGGRTIAFPAAAVWHGGTPPTLVTLPNAMNILTFFTVDAGVTWYAHLVGSNYS